MLNGIGSDFKQPHFVGGLQQKLTGYIHKAHIIIVCHNSTPVYNRCHSHRYHNCHYSMRIFHFLSLSLSHTRNKCTSTVSLCVMWVFSGFSCEDFNELTWINPLYYDFKSVFSPPPSVLSLSLTHFIHCMQSMHCIVGLFKWNRKWNRRFNFHGRLFHCIALHWNPFVIHL